jgi:hypothetical protein
MRDGFDEITVQRGKAPGDQYSDDVDAHIEATNSLIPYSAHPLDSEDSRKELRRLLGWYYLERDRQAENRLQMATDHDFYDGDQWDAEDAAVLAERGQMPLTYNEVAPMVDWMIGTERRMRVDWKVLPRSEDDVQTADVKTKTMKYVSDMNGVPMARSRAFSDAVKGGVGWVDDGVRDDPTQDILYSKYEDWRNVLWDSSAYELDLSDARYLFRWRWVDEDIACAMFPGRVDRIKSAAEDTSMFSLNDEEEWYLGERTENSGGRVYAGGVGASVDTQRRRVRLIECQYRTPCKCQVVAEGQFKGAFFNKQDKAMASAIVASGGASIVDRVMMRVHFAVFTETDLLDLRPSPYRHNQFSLTPIWCYRRSRDRLPYGAIRRVRDIQQDINKRASKAQFMLNTNQVIADKNAVDDINRAADEVSRPDGWIEKNPGKELIIRRDTDAATGQIQIMTLGTQTIQRSVGVNDENLGRKTNAVSGEAIKARQSQGSVSTTEPFDNQLFAIQTQGRKQLSLVEQYYTEEKVIRLTGARGKLDWVKVNQPEIQADGSVRYINDITASMADFVVSEQDYAGTLRQVMFDSLTAMVQKLPPEIGLRLYTIAMQFSDLPNAREIVEEIRRMTGDTDPDKELTPEEQQKAEEQAAMQAEAMQMQREQALLALEEQRAKVAKLNAEAQAMLQGDDAGIEAERNIMRIQAEADRRIADMSDQLRQIQADARDEINKIKAGADTSIEIARLNLDGKLRIAELSEEASKAMEGLRHQLEMVKLEQTKEIELARLEMQRTHEAARIAVEKEDRLARNALEEQRLKAEEKHRAAERAIQAQEKTKQADEGGEKKEAEAQPLPPINITVPVTIEKDGGTRKVNLVKTENGYTATVDDSKGGA